MTSDIISDIADHLVADHVALMVENEALRAERDALRDVISTAGDAMRQVSVAAYNRAGLVCCGRPGEECCGCPDLEWSKDDDEILKTLGPAIEAIDAINAARSKP